MQSGVDSFYKHLPLLNMRCDLDPSRLAVWWSTEHVSFIFFAFATSSNFLKILIVFEIEHFRCSNAC